MIYYLGVRFDSKTNDQLERLRFSYEIVNYKMPDLGFHATLAFSRTKFHENDVLGILNSFPIPSGCAVPEFKLFGTSLVLPIISTWLSATWRDLVFNGATWDHDEYNPHITLAKDFVGNIPLARPSLALLPINISEVFYRIYK